LRKPPANLTEPHVQWHTHGDLYWWITNGITASGMPGFRQQMTDDERWQLLNFLAAMSLGYEARPLSTHISQRDPWLPAIDFRYTAPDGEPVSLFTWREQGRMVLLHFVDDPPVSAVTSVPQDAGFAKQVAMLRSVLDAHAAKCIVVRAEPTAKQPLTAEDGKAAVTKIDPGMPCDVVSDHEQTIDTAWSQYRRSLSDPDFKNERVTARGMWFLIDRFGFVRARWAADEPAPSSEQLASSLKQLMSEPEIRSVDIHARR
jgi:putative copper resistance protein D